MLIVGAGMAGCLAGVLNPRATIIEAAKEFRQNHDAVLRFRDDAISKQVGIPFKKVKVHKAVYSLNDGFVPLTPRLSNLYSRKVTDGKISDRSIWNMDTVERYIAPSNFHEMLADMCGNRIEYDTPLVIDGLTHKAYPQIISTIPMHKMIDMLDSLGTIFEIDSREFKYRPIGVIRYNVPNCDVCQTVYFPEHNTNIYRATLTGEDLLVEHILGTKGEQEHVVDIMSDVFGIPVSHWFKHCSVYTEQKYGKIEPIDETKRKQAMWIMTKIWNIYSLGRYATWRNILLDDVLKDIYQIRKMINGTQYDFMKELL